MPTKTRQAMRAPGEDAARARAEPSFLEDDQATCQGPVLTDAIAEGPPRVSSRPAMASV